jgi:antitoxin PrlF
VGAARHEEVAGGREIMHLGARIIETKREGTVSLPRRWVDHARKILTLLPMITSRLTSKAQTTIPQAVRTALGLLPGDAIAYQIEDGRAVLTRFSVSAERDDPFGTFSEWGSTVDEEAYGKL